MRPSDHRQSSPCIAPEGHTHASGDVWTCQASKGRERGNRDQAQLAPVEGDEASPHPAIMPCMFSKPKKGGPSGGFRTKQHWVKTGLLARAAAELARSSSRGATAQPRRAMGRGQALSKASQTGAVGHGAARANRARVCAQGTCVWRGPCGATRKERMRVASRVHGVCAKSVQKAGKGWFERPRVAE